MNYDPRRYEQVKLALSEAGKMGADLTDPCDILWLTWDILGSVVAAALKQALSWPSPPVTPGSQWARSFSRASLPA